MNKWTIEWRHKKYKEQSQKNTLAAAVDREVIRPNN